MRNTVSRYLTPAGRSSARAPWVRASCLGWAACGAVLSGCSGSGGSTSATITPRPAPDPPATVAAPAEPSALLRQLDAGPSGPDAGHGTPANHVQHTFSEVGRDFDPDLDPAGATLVYASTRHNEHPDIYLKQVEGFAVTQLTSDGGDDVQPRFSPDGAWIAFCSNRAGNWDIWMVDRDGTQLVQLTDDPTDEVSPTWSPDGGQLAFTKWSRRTRRWEVWTLAVDRPGVRKFLCNGMFPDWSPDGRRIAFQRARQRGSRAFGIWTVEFVGEDVLHPTEIVQAEGAACIAPRWSPEGGAIAFTRVDDPGRSAAGGGLQADLWSISVETGVRTRLTTGQNAFNPAWSRDGRVYFVAATGRVETIWSLRPPAGALARDGTDMTDAAVAAGTDRRGVDGSRPGR